MLIVSLVSISYLMILTTGWHVAHSYTASRSTVQYLAHGHWELNHQSALLMLLVIVRTSYLLIQYVCDPTLTSAFSSEQQPTRCGCKSLLQQHMFGVKENYEDHTLLSKYSLKCEVFLPLLSWPPLTFPCQINKLDGFWLPLNLPCIKRSWNH